MSYESYQHNLGYEMVSIFPLHSHRRRAILDQTKLHSCLRTSYQMDILRSISHPNPLHFLSYSHLAFWIDHSILLQWMRERKDMNHKIWISCNFALTIVTQIKMTLKSIDEPDLMLIWKSSLPFTWTKNLQFAELPDWSLAMYATKYTWALLTLPLGMLTIGDPFKPALSTNLGSFQATTALSASMLMYWFSVSQSKTFGGSLSVWKENFLLFRYVQICWRHSTHHLITARHSWGGKGTRWGRTNVRDGDQRRKK